MKNYMYCSRVDSRIRRRWKEDFEVGTGFRLLNPSREQKRKKGTVRSRFLVFIYRRFLNFLRYKCSNGRMTVKCVEAVAAYFKILSQQQRKTKERMICRNMVCLFI